MIDVAGLKARTDIVAVVGRYVELQKRGHEFVGRCVEHSPDNNPSMWVVPNKGFVHCYSCGFNADVIAFVMHEEKCSLPKACEIIDGTEYAQPEFKRIERIERPNRVTSKPPVGEPMPDMTIRDLGRPAAVWCYRDSDGLPLGYVARYDTEAGKEIRCWTWGYRGEDAAAWGCGHWNRPRPLYGLDRLAARPEAPVLIVEGEKAADAAAKLLPAYAVVTWPGGAKAFDRADWQPLERRTVLLWPDADEPGVEAMARIGAILADPKGLACAVSVLDVAGMPDGSDAADALAAGWTTEAVIQWAKPRKRALAVPQPATAAAPAMPEEGPEPAPVSVAVRRFNEELPDLRVYQQDADAVAPQHDPPVRARPRLAVVGGRGYDGAAAVEPDEEPLPLALSESGMADEFAAGNQHDLRYVPEWRERGWLVWTGSRWKREPRRNTAMQRMRAISHALKYRAEAAALSPAGKGRLESKHYCGNVLDMVEFDRRLIATPQQWDADPFLLGVPGGTVDLRTGDMRDCLPEQYITRQAAVAPAEGDTPLFDRVLAQAADGDADVLAYLWRWLGYCLTGDVREESFLFLYGPPACGKSTLIEAVAAILGNAEEGGYAVKADMDWFIETRNEKGAGRMHPLHGARFAHAAETEEGRHWKPAMMKEATGGDTLVGERKYEERYSFRPSHKILIHGNHRPHMRQVDEGLRRRMQIVEYHAPVTEAERDLTLKTRLVAEYPAILFRMVQGCLDWQRVGLSPPAAVVQSREEYFDAEDSFGEWLAASTVRRKDSRLSSSAAHRSYRDWLTERGEHAPSTKRFAALMQSRGFTLFKSGGIKFLRDVDLSAPAQAPGPDPWP